MKFSTSEDFGLDEIIGIEGTSLELEFRLEPLLVTFFEAKGNLFSSNETCLN